MIMANLTDTARRAAVFEFQPSGYQFPKRRSPLVDWYLSTGAIRDFRYGAHISSAGVVVVHPEPPVAHP